MAEALKHFFDRDLVRRLAREIQRAHPSFRSRSFAAMATDGLDDLELLDRGRHIARALAAHLPDDYAEAVDVLLRSLGPRHESDELVGAGMAPFFYLPHTIFVAERGLEHFEISMRAQYELTKRFTAESSIRPFIARYPEETFAKLAVWADDPDPHVRRLVSEGTRLRLPWAIRVRWLDENPDRVLALLELLKDDPASLVRRSVARRSSSSAGCTLPSYGEQPRVALEDVRFRPRRVAIGGRVEIAFALRSTSKRSQELLVDLAVHFVKANGKTAPKVFKLTRAVLPPGDSIELSTSVSLAVHTTRRPRPGRHAVDVVVNGVTLHAGSFDVTAARPYTRRRG